LKPKLGYTSEFSVRSDSGLLYDPDFDENLSKKFSELNVQADSVLTIIDEVDDDPHVDLSLAISVKTLPENEKPIVLPDKVEVPRKPKHANGEEAAPSLGEKRKRSPSPSIKLPEKKRIEKDDIVLVDDSHEGAILID
jgi:ubiquitin-like 1-activating enzyme E1 B